DFITESMMKKGSLKNYKALFLFGASSISNQERDAILDFVSNGGIVISDLNPGILNGYLRPTNRNQLEELFGKITYDGIQMTIMDKLAVKRKFRNESLTLVADKAVMLPGITPFQVTDYGKGSAILLNFSLTAIGNTCSEAAPLDRFLSNLLAAAGIIQPVRVKDVAPGDTIIRVRQGQNLNLIGILADKNNIGKTVEVIIPQNAYIYEPAKGFIQHGNSIKLKLDTPFKLISCFIAKQEKPEIVISSDKVALGKPIMLSLRKITPGTVLLLEIIAPNSTPMPLRKQVITVNAQSVAEFPVWFAYNDQPGSYTLILTDVATGLKNDQKIELYDAHKVRGFITNSNS
ncbi:MAG: hypothetical protein WCP55_21815, partial [Lentisphaerota bacterium]